MRARYLLERPALLQLGATEVVVEEVEGAVDIIDRMLAGLGAPREVIAERIAAARSESQGQAVVRSIRAAALVP
jgi:voltage-gated potassium channel Kch